MTPSTNQMRVDLSKVYPYSLSKKWRENCLRYFPDNKIQAMWYNFSEKGQFEKAKEREAKDRIENGVQLKMDI